MSGVVFYKEVLLAGKENVHMSQSMQIQKSFKGETMRKLTMLIMLIAMASVALSQEARPTAPVTQDNKPPSLTSNSPLVSSNKLVYDVGMMFIVASAAKVPEEYYSFKPTAAVRSFGQILAHVADSQYYFCSIARGEKDPNLNIEQTKTAKADLIAALNQAVSYCDKTYDGVTDISGAQTVKFRGMDTPKLTILNVNNGHASEHYGNLVTYMRLKNIVPPSSDPEVLKQLNPVKK